MLCQFFFKNYYIIKKANLKVGFFYDIKSVNYLISLISTLLLFNLPTLVAFVSIGVDSPKPLVLSLLASTPLLTKYSFTALALVFDNVDRKSVV